MYLKYNDNELIYLIKEGIEEALKVLFKKYDILIKTMIKGIGICDDKKLDMFQEGRMVLYDCLRKYDSNHSVSFFSYFSISFKRKISKEISTDYYMKVISFNESIDKDYPKVDTGFLWVFRKYFDNDNLALMIYERNLIGDDSLRSLAIETGLSYSMLYRKRLDIIRSMKKFVD